MGVEVAKPVVTISGAYGAGGALVGPRVADRLGVTFWDRAISAAIAAELAEHPERVNAVEDDLARGIGHWISLFAPAGAAYAAYAGIPVPDAVWGCIEASYKERLAVVFRSVAEHGAVILGRGAAIVLAGHPGALHVRLDGPLEARIAQVVDLGGLNESAARRAQNQTDTARHRYVHRLYHADVADHRHYHLWIDATAVPLATCVEIIVGAVAGREQLRQLRHGDGDRT